MHFCFDIRLPNMKGLLPQEKDPAEEEEEVQKKGGGR